MPDFAEQLFTEKPGKKKKGACPPGQTMVDGRCVDMMSRKKPKYEKSPMKTLPKGKPGFPEMKNL